VLALLKGCVAMTTDNNTYESIRIWKDNHISDHLMDTLILNRFHDTVMQKVFELAIIRLGRGNPPCGFCWFITGSAGRYEQGVISDQDHGLIYEITNSEYEEYFLQLGKEIAYGLNSVGYPYCLGNVMSSNPNWCKSIDQWKLHLLKKMEEGSWESIRNLQIFYDARCLVGAEKYVVELKAYIYDYQKRDPHLLVRFMENVMHIKNAIGPLGQMIVEEYGKHRGSIDLKYSAFIPYVNAIRILAIKEGLNETSTLDRIERLMLKSEYNHVLKLVKVNFEILLGYRLSLSKINEYDDTHFLRIKDLDRQQKKEMKRILQEGKQLHHYVRGLINKGCS
jgi:CBS domain-containing protein